MVTPHAGVWIETNFNPSLLISSSVTPHAGVWIETEIRLYLLRTACVTPHAGVWIETTEKHHIETPEESHASCRRVD